MSWQRTLDLVSRAHKVNFSHPSQHKVLPTTFAQASRQLSLSRQWFPGFCRVSRDNWGLQLTEHDALKQRHENVLQEGICAAQQIPGKKLLANGHTGQKRGQKYQIFGTLVTGHGHCACWISAYQPFQAGLTGSGACLSVCTSMEIL